jgi:hypothetical protein
MIFYDGSQLKQTKNRQLFGRYDSHDSRMEAGTSKISIGSMKIFVAAIRNAFCNAEQTLSPYTGSMRFETYLSVPTNGG